MPATTARALRATITAFQTTITVDANTGMQVGGYLFHDGTTGHTGTTGEYMLITDIDGTILTVVPYVLSQTDYTSLLKKLAADTDECSCDSTCRARLLIGTNAKLLIEGLKPATSAEIVFNEFCKPRISTTTPRPNSITPSPTSVHFVTVTVRLPYSKAEFDAT